jgi:LEA14-like dessication related protein
MIDGNPVFSLGIKVQNTSNQSFQINAMEADVYTQSGGQNVYIGSISQFNPAMIGPRSETVIPVNVSMQLTAVVNSLIKNFTTKNYKSSFNLKGYANVNNIQIPLDLNFTF